MTTVRFYRDETKCSCCGRYIRNVIAIDEQAFGTTCGEIELKKIASENIEITGRKSLDFSLTAQEIIAKQNAAYKAELYKALPFPQWGISFTNEGLISDFLARIGKPTVRNFITLMKIRNIDIDAVLASEFNRLVME